MEIKEMPIEEKYNRLLDEYLLGIAMGHVLHKELGVCDKANDLWVKAHKKMYPSYLDIAFKVLKAITPGKVFKQAANSLIYHNQAFVPLSNAEVNWVSDREVVVKTKNCVILKRMKDLVKKADLDVDPNFICEDDSKILPELAKEFGVDLSVELEQNGCITTAKLK